MCFAPGLLALKKMITLKAFHGPFANSLSEGKAAGFRGASNQ
jgi:hypothetical protein